MKKLLPILFLATTLHSDGIIEPELLPKMDGLNFETPLVVLPPHKNTAIAVGLSTLMPGLGHLYLGDYRTASGLMGSTSFYAGLCFLKPNSMALLTTNLYLMSCNWSYGIYASYRDVRAFNIGEHYSYQMPNDSLADLALAPFQWSVMKKREVWLALLVDLSVAMGLQYFLSEKSSGFSIQKSTGDAVRPFTALPIGIGEESLFRGFLQSFLAEMFNPWSGIALSSLAFGAAHIPNVRGLPWEERRDYYATVLPFITLSSLYYGWVTYKNCSLKEAVALHSWYDFTIFVTSYALSKSVGIGEPFFAFSIPF